MSVPPKFSVMSWTRWTSFIVKSLTLLWIKQTTNVESKPSNDSEVHFKTTRRRSAVVCFSCKRPQQRAMRAVKRWSARLSAMWEHLHSKWRKHTGRVDCFVEVSRHLATSFLSSTKAVNPAALLPLSTSGPPVSGHSPPGLFPLVPPSDTSRPMLSLWLSPFLLLSLPSSWGQGLSSCPWSSLPGPTGGFTRRQRKTPATAAHFHFYH